MSSPLALPILDEDLDARLRVRMDEVEKALLEHVQSEASFVTEAARHLMDCLLYTSPSPRDGLLSRMPSSA